MGSTTGTTSQCSRSTLDSKVATPIVANDEALAFSELVREHSAMVLGVCRRLLPGADADDAAQAVFILCWRKFSKMPSHVNVAGWLHRTSVFVCRNAIRSRTTRLQRERDVDATAATNELPPDTQHHWLEVRMLIDQEVSQLPENLRVPFILFHLKGNTLEEVSKATGSCIATVGTRLQRARQRLAGQLRRRGVGLEVAVIAGLLSSQSLVGNASEDFTRVVVQATTSSELGQSLTNFPIAPEVREFLEAQAPSSTIQNLGRLAMGALLVAFCCSAFWAWWRYDGQTRFSPSYANLQGEWHEIYHEQNGKPIVIPSDVKFVSVLQINGTRFRRFQRLEDGRVLGDESGMIKLNETTSPSQIDFRFWNASIHGVFELQGDQLQVCVTTNSGSRPLDLTTMNGDDRMLTRYLRATEHLRATGLESSD